MKRFVFLMAAGFLFLNFSCQSPSKDSGTYPGDTLELTVEGGDHWQEKMKVAFFSVKKTPQMAAWIEDEGGRYIATITVTNRGARQKWRGSPKEGRPEALPVWNYRQKNNTSPGDIDAASTATPKGSVEAKVNKTLLSDGNTYNVFFEINHSYDYNDYWTEENSGVNGQPSLVYHAQFTAGKPGSIKLVPVGHGSVDGSTGTITNSLGSITTALDIVKQVTLKSY